LQNARLSAIPFILKKAYMAPSGRATSTPGTSPRFFIKKIPRLAQSFQGARDYRLAVADRGQAGALGEHRRAGGVVLDQLSRSALRPRGTTIQPRRQPVISQLLEKVLVLIKRSSASQIARNDGATPPEPPPSLP